MNRQGNWQNFRHGGSWRYPPPQPPELGQFFPQQLRPPARSNDGTERIDKAVAKARRDMIAAGEHVSSWKVSRVALLILEVDSWETLGIRMNYVPSLYSLICTEGKINAFIHCFMGVRKIISLYDLELGICENEGIEKFEELELGPFLKHPLVIHYFSLSPDVTEVFQIKSEDIISYLHKFVDKSKGKEVKNDELLDFIASKRSVTSKEMQQVRIRSLGLHIAHIKRIRRSEQTMLKNCVEKKSSKKRSDKLSSSENEIFVGDHMRYIQSSDEEDNNGNECENNLDGNINSVDEVGGGSCPLEAEEEGHPGEPSRRKSKTESTTNFSSPEVSRKVRTFIKTWKEHCMQNDANEVLEMMLDSSFKGKKNGKNKRKTVMSFFEKNNGLALLHLAVASIRRGMWDSMLDTSNTSHQHEVADKVSESSVDNTNVKVELEPAAKVVSPLDKTNLKHEEGITVEDVMRKVTTHLDLEADFLEHINQPREKLRLFLRTLYKCESSLIEQFVVKDFEALGYGEFLTFLEKHVDLLPDALLKCLIGEPTEKASLGVYLLPLQLNVLISQASNNMWQNETISTEKISDLLTRQFPLVCFEIAESESIINFLDRKSEGDISSGCVIFSATLLGMPHVEDSSTQNEKSLSDTKRFEINSCGRTGILGIMTTKDAAEVLCKAPMLADLELWSHWDLVFAPSLGPLLPWLLNEVHTKELRCLVTKGGKVIRLDHSATVGSFLEVLRRGSSFETAVQLLSLISLEGGERNVPVSLLKWHARKAFEVLLNSSSAMELEDEDHLLAHENDLVSMASRFVLDCLGYLPIEFCSFAADILLSGLQAIVKNAPTIILSECGKVEQRIMLHEVGSSLNVVEWISDYHLFNSSTASNESISSRSSCLKAASSSFSTTSNVLNSCSSSGSEMKISDQENTVADSARVDEVGPISEVSMDNSGVDSKLDMNSDPARIIETIRLEEFGLDQSLSATETTMLKKQHARLGRALNCLSHELYSQDSHFLLELVQNADDNVYPGNVEPTLAFILQEKGIIVLNNERGFSAENIKALCDVGNSTKKKNVSGYIGKKGIGFKSVFRVTDTPEIHSGGFHIKFDISEGQIGFILPTVVPPCDTNSYARLVAFGADQTDLHPWNTCIVLPFRSKLLEDSSMSNIIKMFSDLNPSLLLFLRRLQCVKFKNMLDDTLVFMKKEVLGNGIVKVSVGEKKLTWLVVSQKLHADIRPDVGTTEISIAFTLKETENGDYIPHLEQQPVFAFLPLRTYGFKFILQADFILPSSREEVDADNPWNQWLILNFPTLFVSAERSFCDLPCFRGSPGKAVSAFMDFVPLPSNVHGFFSGPCRTIISRLQESNCLISEDDKKFVRPSEVLRNWTEQDRALLPDSLLKEHLGLQFLDKDIFLSDPLARALGVEEYGLKVLLQVISSLCCSKNGLKSMGLSWLSSWINAIFVSSTSRDYRASRDLLVHLRKIPFIPLSNGDYGSVDEGAIWLHSEAVDDYSQEVFPVLYKKLRVVNPALLSAAAGVETSCFETFSMENVTRMLHQVGVQKLSAHEIVKAHILPAISADRDTWADDLMTEYLAFVMFHLQSSCTTCNAERATILTELCSKFPILTNYGYKRPVEVPIHFRKDFGNAIDLNKLSNGIDFKWHLVDSIYLRHPVTKSVSGGMLKWRSFFQELGVADFVHIVQTEKKITNVTEDKVQMLDWESEELGHLVAQLSSKGDREKRSYFLEILDTLWDTCFSDKVNGYSCDVSGERKPFKSSLISMLHNCRWVNSSIDDEAYYPKDIFHRCEAVQLILGASAPYAVPKVSEKMLQDIEFKTQVTLDDMLSILKVWRTSTPPFKASVLQMSRYYSRIWKEMSSSKSKITEAVSSGHFIFVPCVQDFLSEDLVPGVFMSAQEVHWQDSIVSTKQAELLHSKGDSDVPRPYSNAICDVYPELHDFFVKECGVNEIPPLCSYLDILLHLSNTMSPSEAAKEVFEVFLKWGDGLTSGSLCSEDIESIKENLLRKEYTVLPTGDNKWVSLHPSFGLVCWSDDDTLRNEFENCDGITFLYFCELTDEEKQLANERISTLMQRLGIPALSEVLTRKAIYYGPTDNKFITSLVEWALPYAQRYICNLHPNKYFQLKQSGFESLRCLRIVVVEQLFYRNVLKGSHIASKGRSECSCLLQGNFLYAAREVDHHSLFMELSRLLYGGIQELHLANFLHMITSMAQSGSTSEQVESFIQNGQKVPKLPAEESVWCLSALMNSTENDETSTQHCGSQPINHETNYFDFRKKIGIDSSWPSSGLKMESCSTSVNQSYTQVQEAGDFGYLSVNDQVSNMDVPDMTVELDSVDGLGSREREQLSLATTDEEQAMLTGRIGELVAFKYFVEKAGKKKVKWVNEEDETGLPYDIVIEGKDERSREYIEVKSTKSAKGWFAISVNEWQFAVEKGESFSVARVVLSDNKSAIVKIYKDPVRLCQLGELQLGVLIPKPEGS